MDRNVYQSELDRVRFTEAGKSALTDALLAEQAAPAEQRGRSPWMKRGAMAAPGGGAAGGHGGGGYRVPVGHAFSADWTRRSRRWWTPSAAVCRGRSPPDGAVMTPQAAFGTDGVFYLMLEIRPEGTVLPALDGGTGDVPALRRGHPERRVAGAAGAGRRRRWTSLRPRTATWLEDDDPTDTRDRLALSILADGDLEETGAST